MYYGEATVFNAESKFVPSKIKIFQILSVTSNIHKRRDFCIICENKLETVLHKKKAN